MQYTSSNRTQSTKRLQQQRIWTALAVLILPACTLLRFDDSGATVSLFAESNVQNCDRVGYVQAVVRRTNVSEEDYAEALLANARRQAARLGGDTIVEDGPGAEQRQGFIVYRCNPPVRTKPPVVGIEIEKAL